jgi:hypothetical protein
MNVLILSLVLALAQEPPVEASRPGAAGTVVDVRVESGEVVADLHTDLDALLLGQSAATPLAQRLAGMESLRSKGREAEAAAIERLSEHFRRRVRVRFEGAAAALAIEYPEQRSGAAGELTTLGSFVRLRAAVPAAARAFTFFASRSLRWIDLRVTIGERRSRQMLEPGEESGPVALH